MSECTHDCSSCGENCSERKTDFREKPNKHSHVKKVIGIVSGKGGVGKSLVTSLLAVGMQRRGYKTAIMDADVTGPSIPRIFGITEKASAAKDGIYPVKSKFGTSVMSINCLLENDTDPVIWRGPVIAGVIKQFWTDVMWGDVDYMFVDMPPGTGDVPLTVFQSLPVDGIIVVTSPQQLVGMIVGKAVKMANMMNIPVLALVENMSYFECPDCHKKYEIFGVSHLAELSREYGISDTAALPFDPNVASLCDRGLIELTEINYLESLLDAIEK